MGERLSLTIPLIEAGNLPPECIELVPLPGGADNAYFPRRTAIVPRTDKDGRIQSIALNGPTISEPVIEFRVQTRCGTAIARDYTLLSMPSPELRYAPAVIEPAVTARTPPVRGETAAPPPGRPGPSLEQMAGSRFPDRRDRREAFKRQMRALNAVVLQGIGDNAPIPLDTELRLPSEDAEPALPPPAVKEPAKRKTEKKPAKGKPVSKPAPQPAPVASPEAVPTPVPVSTAVTPNSQESQDRLQISRGGSMDGKSPQPGSLEARLADHAADTFAKQAELTARLEQTERAYNDLKEVILRMEERMLAVEKERLRLIEESQKKEEWGLVQIALGILGGGIVGAAAMVLAQNRRRRRESDAMFDIGEIRKK